MLSGCSEKERASSASKLNVQTETKITFADGSILVGKGVGGTLEEVRVIRRLPDGTEQQIEAKQATVSDDVRELRAVLSEARIYQPRMTATNAGELILVFTRADGKVTVRSAR
jgi:uncharacterized membrane protein YcjF (UPF0283 family)